MNVSRQIWLLTDYRGTFCSTVQNGRTLCSLDLDRVRVEFETHGYALQVVPYADVDLRRDNFKNRLVVYQSSEDRGSHYRSYIEDVLLGISLQGAVLIPQFHFFRAHHNKVFMEILRDLSGDPQIQQPCARAFGTFEDFKRWQGDYPRVIKQAEGAGSRGVRLVRTAAEGGRTAARFSASASLGETVRELAKRWLRRKEGYVPYSLHRRKFILQEFIPGLTGDYKVLVYWDRYYVLHRDNRPNDFRASGSGRFTYPKEPPFGLLAFARRVFEHFQVPMISLDIAMAADTPLLVEFQFIGFGTYTIEKSDWFFQWAGERWERVTRPSVLEAEAVRSITIYVEVKGLLPGS